MTGVFGSDARLQTLLEKTASRHDISYIALVDRNGVILAHNEKELKLTGPGNTRVPVNTVQAMEKGGHLTVATHREIQSIIIDISDTGPGISLEDQSNVFNPYFTTKKKGTGLGLAIVHKIVEDHGGSIRIHSEEGHGTRISITLPLHPLQET